MIKRAAVYVSNRVRKTRTPRLAAFSLSSLPADAFPVSTSASIPQSINDSWASSLSPASAISPCPISLRNVSALAAAIQILPLTVRSISAATSIFPFRTANKPRNVTPAEAKSGISNSSKYRRARSPRETIPSRPPFSSMTAADLPLLSRINCPSSLIV